MDDPKRRRLDSPSSQGFKLNSDQERVVEYILAGWWTMLYGGPGTGKSATIQAAIRRIVEQEGREDALLVCAPSAMAAKNLSDDGIPAATIHSCFGIKVPEDDDLPVASAKPDRSVTDRIRRAIWLVADEVSMIHWPLLSAVDITCRRARKGIMVQRFTDPDGPQSKEVIDALLVPFGGLVFVGCGDLFQLPPVPTAGKPETGVSFVLSEKFQTMAAERVTYEFLLRVNVRQERGDPLLRFITEMMETGSVSGELRSLLESRTLDGQPLPHDAIYICRRNDHREKHNAEMQERLEKKTPLAIIGQWPVFVAQDVPEPLPYDPKEDLIGTPGYAAHHNYLWISRQFRTQPSIRLLPGSRVRVARNISIKHGVVRGALGTVVSWRQHMLEKGKAPTGNPRDGEIIVTVKLDGRQGTTEIRSEPENYYRNKVLVAKRIGLPLIDGYASTVDSTQSCTFHGTKGVIKLDELDTSALGTAISRFRRLDQIFTVGKLPPYIRGVRPDIMSFLNNLRKRFDDLEKGKV